MIDDDVSKGNSCIVLCDRISQIEDIKNRLGDYAVMVTGSMTSKKDKKKREEAIQDMRDKKKMCLIASVKLAAAGLDIKGALIDFILDKFTKRRGNYNTSGWTRA